MEWYTRKLRVLPTLRRWGAPLCLKTYSTQYTPRSSGSWGRSENKADSLFTLSWYLKKKLHVMYLLTRCYNFTKWQNYKFTLDYPRFLLLPPRNLFQWWHSNPTQQENHYSSLNQRSGADQQTWVFQWEEPLKITKQHRTYIL